MQYAFPHHHDLPQLFEHIHAYSQATDLRLHPLRHDFALRHPDLARPIKQPELGWGQQSKRRKVAVV